MYLVDVTVRVSGVGVVWRGHMRFERPHVQLSWGLGLVWLLREVLCRCRDGRCVVGGRHGGWGFIDVRESMRGQVDKVGRWSGGQRRDLLGEAIGEWDERVVPQ